MEKLILDLAKKFIEIPSLRNRPERIEEILKIAIAELNDFNFVPFESEGVESFLFTNGTRGDLKFKYILNAHLDVVDARDEEFRPYEKDGKLFGRGAYDMKSAAAAMILLFKKIANQVNFPLGLQITTDEEVGGENGTAYQIKNGVRAEFAITGEGTNFNIIHESKIRMLLKLTANGKSSHGAYPWLGDNAIYKMQEAIMRLHQEYPIPRGEWMGTTLNVTSISTENKADNRTPDHCEALVDARVLHAEKQEFLDNIQRIVTPEIKLEQVIDSDSHYADPSGAYIRKLQEMVNSHGGIKITPKITHGSSDMRFFTTAGIEGIEFGPVGGDHHSDGEWVDIKSLGQYYLILKDFLLT